MKRLVAVDWGTSSLRGALLTADGAVEAERAFAHGILSVAAGGFPALFETCFGDWMARGDDVLCLIAGMAGSRQGWVETPYCGCPAGLSDLVVQLHWIEAGRIAVVPGLCCEHGSVPDVMRGEETQIFGALRALGIEHGRFVLPGTHSKWAVVEAGQIVDFSTAMTGEFYALLRRHSILARSLPDDDGAFDPDAFDAGVALARRSAGLLQSAFSLRTLALFDRMPAAARPSYLSGLVIGEELRSQLSLPADDGPTEVIVVGADALTLRYERALSQCGIAARRLGAAATWNGLSALAADWWSTTSHGVERR